MRTHLKSRTIKDRVALTTADSQTERPFHPSSQRNVFENTRTNSVLTPDAGISVDTSTSSQNVQQLPGVVATTNGATTQTNLVANDRTTHSDNKRTTSKDLLTSGKDTAVTEETTGSLTGRYMAGGDRTTQQEMTQGLTSRADETSSSSPVRETEGPSRTLSGRGLTADGAKRATTAGNNLLGMGDATEVVTDIVTVTGSPVVKEVEVTEVVTELEKTVKDVGYNISDPPRLTTVVPTTEPQTTSSPCKLGCK